MVEAYSGISLLVQIYIAWGWCGVLFVFYSKFRRIARLLRFTFGPKWSMLAAIPRWAAALSKSLCEPDSDDCHFMQIGCVSQVIQHSCTLTLTFIFLHALTSYS